jgi:hypothetical protein
MGCEDTISLQRFWLYARNWFWKVFTNRWRNQRNTQLRLRNPTPKEKKEKKRKTEEKEKVTIIEILKINSKENPRVTVGGEYRDYSFY